MIGLEPMIQPGAFNWNELNSTDIKATKNFYGGLLGRSLQDPPCGDMTSSITEEYGPSECCNANGRSPESRQHSTITCQIS